MFKYQIINNLVIIDFDNHIFNSSLKSLFKSTLFIDLINRFCEKKGIKLDKEYLFETDKTVVYYLVEEFYDYWRKYYRFCLVTDGTKPTKVIRQINKFNDKIVYSYRRFCEHIKGNKFSVYRELPAGINVGFILGEKAYLFKKDYLFLNNIKTIKQIILKPPFIIYSRANKREGFFTEVFDNPIKKIKIKYVDQMICYPVLIGETKGLVYVDMKYLHILTGLANLMEIGSMINKPDFVLFFGIKDDFEYTQVYYKDIKNDLLVGYVNDSEYTDYFGNLKKMILTLHNINCLKKRYLPIHGSMVEIIFSEGMKKSLMMIGDSGTGKSEIIEELRKDNRISSLQVVFDDMGYLVEEKGVVFAKGTEIGAFIRIDDLDSGYGYSEIDRTILVNPNKSNARLIVPNAVYSEIIKTHKIDLVLYANNYSNQDDILNIKYNVEMINVFKKGKRMAKNTSSEQGIVETFFGNPFGVMQEQEEANKLIDYYFRLLNKNQTMIGEIYTKLGVSGLEKKGIGEAKEVLIDYLTKKEI